MWGELVLGTLIVWRVCILLSDDRWPFGVGAKLRMRFGWSYPRGRQYPPERNELGLLLSCVFCLSPWVAAPLVWWWELPWIWIIVYSGSASALEMFLSHD